MRAYLIRFVGYEVVLGIAAWMAHALWSSHGLGAVESLRRFHDAGIAALLLAPFVLATFRTRRARALAALIAGLLIGAALTAPYVCAVAAGV